MAEGLTIIINFIVPLVEACGALVITLEVLRTAAQYVIAFLGLRPVQLMTLRMRLGQSMVMGLEFLVAADILKTALSPTWNDILLLAALITLRTILNYLLEHELKMLHSNTAPSKDE